jgi:hypothetical protein
MSDEPTPPMRGESKIGPSIVPLKTSEVTSHIGVMERKPRVHVSDIIRLH